MNDKRGQSIIEYALITILVITGIVLMGPYVLRSINGHFKLWDEGAQKSFHEHLTQAPLNSIPPLNIDCQCPKVPGTCGGYVGSSCAVTQREIKYNCTPADCNKADQGNFCEDDPTCCTGWTNLGCGTVPLNLPPTSTNCHYGYQLQTRQCGGANSPVQCVQDPNCPLPQCVGMTANAIFCATGTTNPPTTGINQNTPISFVDYADPQSCGQVTPPSCTYCNYQNTNPAPACQVYCAQGYRLDSTRTHCVPVLQHFIVNNYSDDINDIYYSDVNATVGTKILHAEPPNGDMCDPGHKLAGEKTAPLLS